MSDSRLISRLLLAPFVALLVLAAVLPRLAAFMLEMVPGGEKAVASTTLTAAVPYGVRGRYSVGTRSLTTDGQPPVAISVWYPAWRPGAGAGAITYPYELKMFGPRGGMAIATFEGQAGRNAPVDRSAAPYPVVILSPGFAMGSASYAWLAEHLASYGLVVLSPEHDEQLDPSLMWRSTITRPSDIRTVLAYAEDQGRTGGALEGLIDGDRSAVIGHSYGGYTALAAAGARFDTEAFSARCTATVADDPGAWLCDALLPHVADMAELADLDSAPDGLWPPLAAPGVDAIVSMAGDAYLFDRSGLAEMTVPVMAIGGTGDSDTPYTWGTLPTYEFASSLRKVRIALEGAGHMVFTGPCESTRRVMNLVPNEFCSDPGWDRLRARRLISHYTTAFLLAELNRDAEAAAALTPDDVGFRRVSYEAQGY